MMIRALHIEDESGNVQLLKSLTTKYCADKVDIVANATNIHDALEAIAFYKPQLVFLDIQLNDGTGFELLEQCGNYTFQVIFITAYNEHAVKAFRINATDYLLKPIDIEELIDCVDRAVLKIDMEPDKEKLVEEFSSPHRRQRDSTTIGFPAQFGLIFLKAEQIVALEAKGTCTKMYILNEQPILCSKNLKQITSLLPTGFFIRIHHSWVASLHNIKKYYRGKSSYLEMIDGSTVPVSVRRKGDLLDQFLK